MRSNQPPVFSLALMAVCAWLIVRFAKILDEAMEEL